MNFVCENCGWVGTKFELGHGAGVTECPNCGESSFIRIERKAIPG